MSTRELKSDKQSFYVGGLQTPGHFGNRPSTQYFGSVDLGIRQNAREPSTGSPSMAPRGFRPVTGPGECQGRWRVSPPLLAGVLPDCSTPGATLPPKVCVCRTEVTPSGLSPPLSGEIGARKFGPEACRWPEPKTPHRSRIFLPHLLCGHLSKFPARHADPTPSRCPSLPIPSTSPRRDWL